jgi:hypothetical protein
MSMHSEGSLQLCDVRIRSGLDDLEEAGREPQRHMCIGANVGVHYEPDCALETTGLFHMRR